MAKQAPLQIRIQNSVKHVRDREIRQKVELFLQAIRLGSVQAACTQAGKAPRYYYYWYNRYRDAGFDVTALQKKSRAPKRTRRIPPSVSTKILRYHRQQSLSSEQIRLYLERDHQVRVSRATVYRLLKAEGLVRKKRASSAPRGRAGSAAKKFTEPKFSFKQRTIQNRYFLERELGSGGGGTVYLAQDQRQRKPVALKVLEMEKLLNPSLIASLKAEFSALSRLRHRHLAQVHDFSIAPREVFFTSDYIKGEDILRVAERSNLNTVFDLVLQILRALDYLHGRGVLHLDLKPQNILVGHPGKNGEATVKLIDFGGAQWKNRGEIFTGAFVGTPPYIPPEVILERGPTAASDIYSLGILLFQIFAGRVPFSSSDPVQMMKEQVYGEPLTSIPLHPALPSNFLRFLLKMINKDPLARFGSPREVVAAMNDCLGENFSLRGREAPRHVLEESDFYFREAIAHDLTERMASRRPQTLVISGASGAGKTRLCRRIKNALQLAGLQPEEARDLPQLQAALTSQENRNGRPLIVDGVALSQESCIQTLSQLENLGGPVLLTTSLPSSPALNPSAWIELQTLAPQDMQAFLDKETIGTPPPSLAREMAEFGGADLRHLENLLQAMREAEWIQWSEQGWRWTGKAEGSASRLLKAQSLAWERRLAQVRELLSFFPPGMSASTLAGILELEQDALQDRLEAWISEGALRRKIVKKTPQYFLAIPKAEQNDATKSVDWSWARGELERLYHQGAFSAGVELAQTILAQPDSVPEALSLWCARHLVAAGHGKEGLRALPHALPRDTAVRGMYFELRGRVHLDGGEFEAAQQDLDHSEENYGAAEDRLGLSRVHNVRASLFKRLGKFPEAETAYRDSIAQAEAASAPYPQGMSQMNLAILYYEQGDFPRAQENFLRAFALEKAAGHPLLSTKLRDNWVNLLFYMGRSAEAESCCYELLRIALQHRYPQQQAAAYSYLALLAAQKGQHDLQLNYLNQALALLDPAKHPLGYFQGLVDRGYAQWNLRKHAAAQIDAEAALMLAHKRRDPTSQAIASLLLGKILRDRPRPDLEQASYQLNLAHQGIHAHRVRQLLWEVEYDRGLLAKKCGNAERAKNYFLSAQTLLHEFLQDMPEEFRKNFLRDRKQERIEAELQAIGGI